MRSGVRQNYSYSYGVIYFTTYFHGASILPFAVPAILEEGGIAPIDLTL